MNGSIERKEGELSPEETALAKKFFVSFAFLVVAVSIVAAEYVIPIEYVLVTVVMLGIVVTVWSCMRVPKKEHHPLAI